MGNYSFINPDADYDGSDLWNKFRDMQRIFEEDLECTERVRIMTGDVFRTEGQREKYAALVGSYPESKRKAAEALAAVPQENISIFRDNFENIVNVANIQRDKDKNNSLLVSMLNSLLAFKIKHAKIKLPDGTVGRMPPESQKLILSIGTVMESAVHIYNNLLADLFITKTELDRLDNMAETGMKESRFVWWHDGQRLTLPYAVSTLMVDLAMLKRRDIISETIGLFSSFVPEADAKTREGFDGITGRLEKNSGDVLEDIRNIYGNFTRGEIEKEAEKFQILSFAGLELPGEDMIGLAMKDGYCMAEASGIER